MKEGKKEEKTFPAKATPKTVIVKVLNVEEIKSKIKTTASGLYIPGTDASNAEEINPLDIVPVLEKYTSHPWSGIVMASGCDWIEPCEIVGYNLASALQQEYINVEGEIFKVLRESEVKCIL